MCVCHATRPHPDSTCTSTTQQSRALSGWPTTIILLCLTSYRICLWHRYLWHTVSGSRATLTVSLARPPFWERPRNLEPGWTSQSSAELGIILLIVRWVAGSEHPRLGRLQHVLMFGDTQMHACIFGNTSQRDYPKKGSGERQGRFMGSCGPRAL